MTRTELNNLLNDWADGVSSKNKTLALIWGQPFDGETEKINTTKSVSPTSPTTEESSAVVSKAEARVAELRDQISALAQVHEVIKAEARVAELREQMSALAQAHEIWLRDAAMKEEHR